MLGLVVCHHPALQREAHFGDLREGVVVVWLRPAEVTLGVDMKGNGVTDRRTKVLAQPACTDLLVGIVLALGKGQRCIRMKHVADIVKEACENE